MKASVHIGIVAGSSLVQEFYKKCALETIAAARIPTGEVKTYKTFEELIDQLQAQQEAMQVIVNHGNTSQGVIVPFTAGAHNSTGPVMDDLAALAKSAGSGALDPKNSKVVNIASIMGVKPATAVRLATKLNALRSKNLILEIRGCNIGANSTMLRSYKSALGALMVTAPNSRMFYVRIRPHKPSSKQTMSGLSSGSPKTAKTRRRTFRDSSGVLDSLIIDVRDIDGHSKVDTESFSTTPGQAASWGAKLLGAWKQSPSGTGNDSFVMEVLWNDGESSYHCPDDLSYRQKLVSV